MTDKAKRIAMIVAPVGLVAFSLSHGTLSWSETQHLRNAGLDEWIQHLTNIQGRWLAAHIGGLALFPLIGIAVWQFVVLIDKAPTRSFQGGPA